jgi:hypothetical protein
MEQETVDLNLKRASVSPWEREEGQSRHKDLF